VRRIVKSRRNKDRALDIGGRWEGGRRSGGKRREEKGAEVR
jgi:hypothetical protein